MSIVITGATGFVMANLARHLAELGHAVVAADVSPPDTALAEFLSGLPGAVTFRQVEVTDRQAVGALVREARPVRVVHGAAITAIPEDAERARFFRTADVNVMGTLTVLEALREAGAPGRIVVVSSGSVYGGRPDLTPIGEDDAKTPQALYPLTKWAAEALAARFAEVHGLDAAVVRLTSPFGPFERDTGSRPLLSPMQRWCAAAVRGEPVRVSGPPDQARDAVYVGDVASGIAAVLLADRLPHRVYNVGWGQGTTAGDALSALTRLVPGLRVEFHPEEPSPWRSPANPPRGPLSVDRLRQDLGWAPRYDLDSWLAAYLAWLRATPSAVAGRSGPGSD